MKPFWHKLEVFIDKIIPFALILLIILIIAEIFYAEAVEPYHHYIDIVDYAIILIFVIDLTFKYIRIRNFKNFLKSSWLEIIAIFPAFLFIRVAELFIALTRIEIIADSAHGILETSAKWTKIVQEVEREGKVSRFVIAHNVIRPLARLPRLAKAFVFFEKPTGKPSQHGQ